MTGVYWSLGIQKAPSALGGVPLGYDRALLAPGERLPKAKDTALGAALRESGQIIAAFNGKLGDALLAFPVVRALTEAHSLLTGRSVSAVAVGRHAGLLTRTCLTAQGARSPGSEPAIVVGDESGIAQAGLLGRTSSVLLCRPEEPPRWVDSKTAYDALPDRYYLDIERRIGVRLPSEPPFLPTLAAHAGSQPQGPGGTARALRVAAITATSRPERKDYGTTRFSGVAADLSARTGRLVHLFLVAGLRPGGSSDSAPESPGVATTDVVSTDAADLIELFAECDLVLGNDTGLTHLAAMSRRCDGAAPEVIGLYARHSHSKWRTGLPNHHALATGFSHSMHLSDSCPVRDRIDDSTHGAEAELATITTGNVVDAALRVVE